MLGCVLATIGYFNRAKLLTLALEQVAAPNRIETETTRFDGLSGISFDGVSVFAPGEETPFAKADSVATEFTIDGLRSLHLDSLEFSGLALDIPASMLERPPSSDQPEKQPSTSPRTLSLGSLSLPDTKITAALPDGTTISANVSLSGSDISLTGSTLKAKDQKIAIADARATLPDGTSLALTEAASTIDFLPDPLLKNTTISGTVTLPQSASPLTFSIESPTLAPTKKTGTGNLKLSGSPVPGLKLDELDTDVTYTADGITLSDLQLGSGSFNYNFTSSPPASATKPEKPSTTSPGIPPITIASASTTLDLDLENVPGCGDVTARSTIDLSDVTYRDGAASSPVRQSVSFSDIRVKLLDDFGTASAETASASIALTPESAIPATLHELSVTGGEFSSTASPTKGLPALRGKFAASSTAGMTSLQVSDLTASTPDPDAPAFSSINKITVTLDPTTCLDTKHIESITISEASTTISDPVLTYLKGTQTSDAPSATPDASLPEKEASWTLGKFVVNRSSAIIADILPGLPPLPFSIDTTFHDVPLSKQGFVESEVPQKLTLSKVTLSSQLNPLVPVIQFGELSVNFTLGGLLREEIDSILVTNPDLYIGKHLFWYISFFQDQPKKEADDGPAPDTDTDTGGWTISNIEAVDGSLILAPQGHPVPGIKPLPFAGRTRLVDGQLNFDIVDPGTDTTASVDKLVSIKIPKGDYPLNAFNLDLEANLVGLSGEVAFNLPVAAKNTNFVETLKADRIIFEQLELTEAFIVVTYDQEGVYASFGGYAYGGYTNGEVNLYLDQDWSWDGWIAATGIDFDPLTTALTPTAIHITGAANAKVVADGDLKALEHLTSRAELTATKPGTLDIIALANVVENLSDDTPSLTKQLATVGLDVLEKFYYEAASINVATSGYEGNATLDLTGPSGRRTIEINSHDVRFRPPTVTTTP